MGAQDSLDQAVQFVEDGGIHTPLMVWDAGFDTWNHYSVRGQPTIILLDPAGNQVAGWVGAFSQDDVLAAVADI